MENSIEIYIRQSVGRNLMNIYVPSELRAFFLRGVSGGTIEGSGIPVDFEMSWMPENTRMKHGPLHVLLGVQAINISYAE